MSPRSFEIILLLVSVIMCFLQERVISPQPNPQPGGPGAVSSGLYPSTNPAWFDLPGTEVPAGTAIWVIETHKLHHHGKVAAQGKSYSDRANQRKTRFVFSAKSLLKKASTPVIGQGPGPPLCACTKVKYCTFLQGIFIKMLLKCENVLL